MILARLASLKLTLIGMLALGVGVFLGYKLESAPLWVMVVPLLLLSVNLLAALATNPRFRRQSGLVVFHYCLLGVLLLASVGRLTTFKGHVEITEGQGFEADLVQLDQEGPWHPRSRLQRVRFTQGRMRIDYEAGLQRGETRSEVVTGEDPLAKRIVRFGDNVPLEASGYRFYTTSNKGYAVLLTWIGKDDRAVTAAVHLDSYPRRDWNQRRRWSADSGTELELELHLPQTVPMDRAWSLDSRDADGALAVTAAGGETLALNPGDTVAVAGGRLRYHGLRMWMGYEIFYDPTLPWLFATALVGVLGLAWHVRGRFFSRPLPRTLGGPAEPERAATRNAVGV